MDIYRKIIILIIVVFTIYLIYRLLYKRWTLLSEMKEGFESVRIRDFPLTNYISKNGVQPESVTPRQFCIKSSCNSAYSGKELTLDALNNVLMRGYRFLDFELSFVNGTGTAIAFNKMAGKLYFTDVLDFIVRNAFSQCPNPKDPLFIQLRPVIPDQMPNLSSFMGNIKSIIEDKLGTYRYSNEFTSKTTMKDISEKVVLIMEIPLETENSNLKDVIHIQPKGEICMTYTTAETLDLPRKDIVRKDDGFSTDIPRMTQILPLGNTNMDMFPYISRLGSQITPMMAWEDSEPLTNYEKVFNENSSAFVPLANMLKKVTEQISIEYPQAFGDKF